MWRTFVSSDGSRIAERGYFLLNRFDAPLQSDEILLLLENLVVEFFDGFVLHGRKGFELDDSFFHGCRIANPSGKGSGFMGFSACIGCGKQVDRLCLEERLVLLDDKGKGKMDPWISCCRELLKYMFFLRSL